MHRNLTLRATLLLSSLLMIGCPAEGTREAPARSNEATISDDEIDSYIVWWRESHALSRKHLREMNDLQERLSSRYSLADLHKVQQDPELLATMERQREAAMEHQRNKPISREKADGFDSVLAGLGRSGNRNGRMVYEIHHDESALRGARDKYGDQFVDKVLSREEDIAAAMNP